MRKMTFCALLLAVAGTALAATGCGQARTNTDSNVVTPTTEAPVVVVTEKVTEAQTETEPPTEKVTEKITEAQTEAETEVVTEAPAPAVALTQEEEQAQESAYESGTTMWALDDVNVREAPSTDAEIIESYDQGEQINVIGETPGWYKIYDEEGGFEGYVSRQWVSETEVAPKSEDERAAAQEALAAQNAANAANEAAADGQAEEAAAQEQNSSSLIQVDGLTVYSESYPITLAADANLRSLPGENGEVLGTVLTGTTVTALGETDRWYEVDYNGTVGFVNKNLVG